VTPKQPSTRQPRRASRPASKQASQTRPAKPATPTQSVPNRPTAQRPASAPVRRSKRLRGPALHAHALEVLERLRRAYPDARTELQYRTPFQLLVATILSAQTTDVRVNMVTPALFARYPDADALAAADQSELEAIIRSTGFFHSKAKSLMGMARALVARYGGTVPASMDDLVTLPGVGRKTANVVLGNAYGRNDGIVVDTHVGRLAVRLGFTTESDPVKVEQVLMSLIPNADWTLISHLLIFHGRRVCTARAPACPRCVLVDICPTGRLTAGTKRSRDEEPPGRRGAGTKNSRGE